METVPAGQRTCGQLQDKDHKHVTSYCKEARNATTQYQLSKTLPHCLHCFAHIFKQTTKVARMLESIWAQRQELCTGKPVTAVVIYVTLDFDMISEETRL